MRVAGIQIPGIMTSGLYRQGGQLAWWDVGRGSVAMVVRLRDEQLATAVVEIDDPAAVMRMLDEAIASAATIDR